MINLLPPEISTQIQYSRYNTILVRYALLIILAGGLLGATLWLTHRYADQQIADYELALSERQDELREYDALKGELSQLNSRLTTIDSLYTQQTLFSTLLQDLAATLPQGAYINSIVLTGEVEQPVQLLVTADTFAAAGRIKNALSASERIESVDIQSINQTGEGDYSVSVVMAFAPGSAQ
ncbi:MAG: PilN domain-containing protein [Candidatus Saccharimonadales bacterium]